MNNQDLTIKELQSCVKKVDFHENIAPQYMLKLMEEVGELAEVVRKNKRQEMGQTIKGTIEEELQDVLYYVVCLANGYGIDLETCIYQKEILNAAKWKRNNMFEGNR